MARCFAAATAATAATVLLVVLALGGPAAGMDSGDLFTSSANVHRLFDVGLMLRELGSETKGRKGESLRSA